MYKYAFLLEFESEHKLTEAELHETKVDFGNRLEGYTTEPLSYVKNMMLRLNDNLASQNEHVTKGR